MESSKYVILKKNKTINRIFVINEVTCCHKRVGKALEINLHQLKEIVVITDLWIFQLFRQFPRWKFIVIVSKQ